MGALFLGFSALEGLVRELAQASEVFASKKAGDDFFWQKHLTDGSTPLGLAPYRAVQPLKSFFFPSRQTVAVYPDHPPAPLERDRPTILWGAKNCDLRSLAVMDHVFLNGDFKDPFYAERRENTLVVASDCAGYRDSCFCIALGINPYPEENLDVCLSEVSGGYLLTSGSPKGESFLKAHEGHFQPAAPAQLQERQERRGELLRSLGEKLAADGMPDKGTHQANVRRNFQSAVWETRAGDCVECGACNLVCPTCHCFLLEDYARTAREFGRTRLWDSCQYKSFSRVAGGANPRRKLAERVRNRFVKKFDFFPDTAGFYACTGCGRCSEACIAKIDIKEILKELASA
jgi:formate hydrogenlyase subunit 6/NADH:ubiquinone oxidoreductase subunit I